MTLYHGRNVVVCEPAILETQRFLDFGSGFYTTSNQQQAERWASIKAKRQINHSKGFVSLFNFDEGILKSDIYQVKIFTSANEEWLDFIFNHRKGLAKHTFDIVTGPVANDYLYATLSLYEADILSKTETIERLKSHILFDQISFHSNAALKELKYFQYYEV